MKSDVTRIGGITIERVSTTFDQPRDPVGTPGRCYNMSILLTGLKVFVSNPVRRKRTCYKQF